MKTRYWCELAWLGGPRVTPGVVIDVDGDRVSAVTPGQAVPPTDATTLKGLTLPALANAHSHAFHRALRGRTHGGRGTFWTWRDLMYRVADKLDPDSYYRLARAAFAEMALAGVGVVGEFHYVHHRPGGDPYSDPNAIGGQPGGCGARCGNPPDPDRHLIHTRRFRSRVGLRVRTAHPGTNPLQRRIR